MGLYFKSVISQQWGSTVCKAFLLLKPSLDSGALLLGALLLVKARITLARITSSKCRVLPPACRVLPARVAYYLLRVRPLI